MDNKNPSPEVAPEQNAAAQTGKRDLNPYEFLASIGGPNREQIEFIKSQSPNGRARIFTPDGKRAFVLRAIGGLELASIEKNIPAGDTNPELTRAVNADVLCVAWTNTTPEKKLNEIGLRTGSAGLPQTLWNLITALSDFVDPAEFVVCSAEL
jgi:hypothetical protein